MQPAAKLTSVTITNPLIKYRALLATKDLRPDPAQHRLAFQLERLYDRLKDYNPGIEYRDRLNQIARTTGLPSLFWPSQPSKPVSVASSWNPFSKWAHASPSAILAMVRSTTTQESALSITSPQGMLLYGEVGRGKSMLLDLFASSLPTGKKRRWHFHNFVLDIFHRLERLRRQRHRVGAQLDNFNEEHSILTMAKDTITVSPIVFLDEFQLPDRAASKIVTSFFTNFFHLGGVLIASSNRMPDELANAAGLENFNGPLRKQSSKASSLRRQRGTAPPSSEASAFMDLLKARCELWEMEGDKDWRRDDLVGTHGTEALRDPDVTATADSLAAPGSDTANIRSSQTDRSNKCPQEYYISHAASLVEDSQEAEQRWNTRISSCVAASSDPTASEPWSSSTLTLYGRRIVVPARTPNGFTRWNFSDLCQTKLGPADYISLASHYHTFILDSVPVLQLAEKNEARRFISLLDALYESRCRLLIRAAAPPDRLFFPNNQTSNSEVVDESQDRVYQETLAEIYQDGTSPFLPNVSVYQPDRDSSASVTNAALNPRSRSVLADEDADFGPVDGNEQRQSVPSGKVDQQKGARQQGSGPSSHHRGLSPDFTKTSTLTGEDERFAFRRAESRIWEMCGAKWWSERPVGQVQDWWRPVPIEERFWERPAGDVPDQYRRNNSATEVASHATTSGPVAATIMSEASIATPTSPRRPRGAHNQVQDARKTELDSKGRSTPSLFRHGASPFRVHPDPPPKFGWQHAWGMMSWGKKAGEWGKGVEGARFQAKPPSEGEIRDEKHEEEGGRG